MGLLSGPQMQNEACASLNHTNCIAIGPVPLAWSACVRLTQLQDDSDPNLPSSTSGMCSCSYLLLRGQTRNTISGSFPL